MKNYLQNSLNYVKSLRTTVANIGQDRVLQNSLYLMSSTGVMAVFGFVFWLVSARLYSATQIGLSSTLITSATTLSLFSLLGFDNVLVRYLPASKNPDKVVDTSILFTSLASIVLSVSFLLALPFISPSLHQLLNTPLRSAFFVLTLLLVTINTLTDSVFIGWQSAKYILLADTGLSIAKVALPIALVAFGAFGIFTGYAVSVTIATVISLWVLGKRFKYIFKPIVHKKTIREVKSFSSATYLANLAAAAPLMALPIMATDALGPQSAAYFNLAMTIATLLFVIPRSTANSLFAEGSKGGRAFGKQIASSVRQTVMILGPATVVILLFGHQLLGIFGAQYSVGSTGPLRILAFSAIPLAFNSLATITLKVKHRLRSLVFVEIFGTVVMLAAAWPMMKMFGLGGAAWAWFGGQVLLAVMLTIAILPVVRSSRAIAKQTRKETAAVAGEVA